MPKYKVLWSLRGLAVVEAEDLVQAIDAFYSAVAEGSVDLSENGGYEADGGWEVGE